MTWKIYRVPAYKTEINQTGEFAPLFSIRTQDPEAVLGSIRWESDQAGYFSEGRFYIEKE